MVGRHSQRGASFFSIMIVLFMAITLLVMGFKVAGPYWDNKKVRLAIESVLERPAELRKRPEDIRQGLYNKLYIDQVKLPSQDALVIRKEAGTVYFDLDYEVRVPMFSNIEAVVKFKESHEAFEP